MCYYHVLAKPLNLLLIGALLLVGCTRSCHSVVNWGCAGILPGKRFACETDKECIPAMPRCIQRGTRSGCEECRIDSDCPRGERCRLNDTESTTIAYNVCRP